MGIPFGLQGGAGTQFPRLTYEELEGRRRKPAKGNEAGLDPREGIHSMAVAGEIGNAFQYVLDQKVSLPRQQSALVPILNFPVEGTKVSIFNEAVHPQFALLGMRFKNSSKQQLLQGPVTVYEDSSYAGDAPLPDLQPQEERLLSYALDLGSEVKVETESVTAHLVASKIIKGILHATNEARETKRYLIKNRSAHDRLVVVEHPIRDDWKLVLPEKTAERSRQFYRFQLPVAAGQADRLLVVEAKTTGEEIDLAVAKESTLQFFSTVQAATPQVKEVLVKALKLRTALSDIRDQRIRLGQQLRSIGEDQARLRANLKEVPPTSEAYKRYVAKFDAQETEVEKIQGQIQNSLDAEHKQQAELADYLTGVNVE
jgi:hypothetical protein